MAAKKKASSKKKKAAPKKAGKASSKTKAEKVPTVNDLLKEAAARACYNPPPHIKAAIKKVMDENDRRLAEARVKKDAMIRWLGQQGHPVGQTRFSRYCEETFGRTFGGG